jgi:glucosamine 6-phosphate synthetase-like amidotransferase/phosphosugar isomerase protein
MSPTRMRTEIGEQPEAIARTIDALVPLGTDLRRLATGARHVLFVARGSSDNAAVYGQYLCSVRAGRLATLASPSVATAYSAELDLRGVLAVGVSQSGRTAEIVETLRWARRRGAATACITNEASSPLAAEAQVALVTQAGAEQALPATKTYSTQLAALAVLCYALADDEAAPARLAAVPSAAAAMLDTADEAEELAQRLTYADRMVVTGRGYAYSTARELALKLTEACYVTALGLSYADLLHGPIAVVDSATPVLLTAAGEGPVLPGLTALASRVAALGGHAYGIGGDAAFAAACQARLPGPDLPEELAPLALVVPGQLLAEALARAKGVDSDTPRGLRKITQTDHD